MYSSVDLEIAVSTEAWFYYSLNFIENFASWRKLATLLIIWLEIMHFAARFVNESNINICIYFSYGTEPIVTEHV
jgi:hypothetical protein